MESINLYGSNTKGETVYAMKSPKSAFLKLRGSFVECYVTVNPGQANLRRRPVETEIAKEIAKESDGKD